MKVFGSLLRSGYRSITKRIRKTVEHKKFSPVTSSLFITAIVAVAIFPSTAQVFGQMQGTPADLVKTDVIATADVIMTTKNTSRYPAMGNISQRFSYYHPGIDIEQPFGSFIYPFLAGIIFETGYHTGGYGNYVLVDHQNGYFSLYAHLNAILMNKGDSVTPETAIGTIGLTGYSTGPHLHLEIYENGRTVNPLSVLPQEPVASMSATLANAEPAVLPARTLVTPLSQTGVYETNEQVQKVTPATGGPRKPEVKSQQEQMGIWLPDSLKQTTAKPQKLTASYLSL